MNFTFDTDVGPLDLLEEVAGVGGYHETINRSVSFELFGHQVSIISLDKLIAAKRASGRPKDMIIIPELESIQELQLAAERQRENN